MDVNHRHISFESGDLILLLTKHLLLKLPGSCKLKPIWVVLYKIVCACSDNSHELELPSMLSKLYQVFSVTLSAILGTLYIIRVDIVFNNFLDL